MRPMIFLILMGMIAGSSATAAFNMSVHDCALQYSAASHCSTASLEAWNCSSCKPLPGFVLTAVVDDPETNIRGFVGYSPQNDTLVVSFRGTVGHLNWLEDSDLNEVPLPNAPEGVEVHQGFLDSYRSVRTAVLMAVTATVAKASPKYCLVTGHSLGGALAVLAVLDLHQTGLAGNFSSVLMYNYGQPRVGNQAFAQLYQALQPASFRVINQRDPVPHLPPRKLPGLPRDTYWHAPSEVWYHGQPPYYETCGPSGEEPDCSDGVIDLDFADHGTYMGVAMSC